MVISSVELAKTCRACQEVKLEEVTGRNVGRSCLFLLQPFGVVSARKFFEICCLPVVANIPVALLIFYSVK